jgi:hypothetical protein
METHQNKKIKLNHNKEYETTKCINVITKYLIKPDEITFSNGSNKFVSVFKSKLTVFNLVSYLELTLGVDKYHEIIINDIGNNNVNYSIVQTYDSDYDKLFIDRIYDNTIVLSFNIVNKFAKTTEKLRSSHKIVHKVLSINGLCFQHINDKFKNNIQYIKLAINSNPECYSSLPLQYQLNKHIAILTVQKNGLMLANLKFGLFADDIQITLEAIKNNYLALIDVSDELRKNKMFNTKLLEHYYNNVQNKSQFRQLIKNLKWNIDID